MKKFVATFILAFAVSCAFTQSFKPDRSFAMLHYLDVAAEFDKTSIGPGFQARELFYLLTEYRLISCFPATGVFYNESSEQYTLWSLTGNVQDYYQADSIVFQKVGSDGSGIWVWLNLYYGSLYPSYETPNSRTCNSIGILVPDTDNHDALGKLKAAKVLTCPCGENPLGKVPKSKLDQLQSWTNADDAMEFLKVEFPEEGRDLELTNFALQPSIDGKSNRSSGPSMIEFLFCSPSTMLHHFAGDLGQHDAYTVRYSFQTRTWTAKHLQQPRIGLRDNDSNLNEIGKANPQR